ncbi:hypothetical protein C0T31_00125 [Dysgonamonadaceae bacterium]|nr:hypothetical protein C0T31_00125 [Dysgonamonadaceae bacterium]
MKRSKFLWVCAVALGFAACTTDEVAGDVNQHATDSYASVTIKFPGKVTRALPGDYNESGTWVGRDKLETVTVFLVNTAKGVVDYNSFAKSSFAEIDATGVLKPNLALKATAGDNVRVYVVINGNTDILSTLKTTLATNFAAAFAGEAAKIASQVATYNTPDNTEVIMMTNDKDDYEIDVVAGVTEEQAKLGTANHVQVNVERVVARAMLTVVPNEGDAWTVKAIQAGEETDIATVTEVTYAVGQSNKKFYIMKKADYSTPDPVYTYVPAGTDWATKNADFDYTGLSSFTTVQEWTYDATDVATPLENEETSKFVLPVNHAVNTVDDAARRAFYKKGNTTYFEIQAKFIPLLVDGEAPAFTEPSTVYWGANDSKFYSTRALAEAQGQKATEFTDGVMKYILWLNPNSLESTPEDPNPKVSPTVRNQVYHAHIDAFLRMGLPNNPLNPDDPNDPANPDNPISPYDPLKSDYTYLSVSVKVLPWTIHSYQISLSDPPTMY